MTLWPLQRWCNARVPVAESFAGNLDQFQQIELDLVGSINRASQYAYSQSRNFWLRLACFTPVSFTSVQCFWLWGFELDQKAHTTCSQNARSSNWPVSGSSAFRHWVKTHSAARRLIWAESEWSMWVKSLSMLSEV